jgi:phosphatidylglycerophosphatase A
MQDNLRGGAGVVMDDVLAGVFGAVGMAVALAVLT